MWSIFWLKTMLTCALIFIISIDTSVANNAEVIFGPTSPNNWQSWFNTISTQRKKDLQSINYNASIFNVSGLDWTQSTFILPHMHGYDQYFYDINTHSYTFDKWLNYLKQTYGGVDAFLFWVTYTNIGADDRNQFEINYAVPGSLKILKSMVNYMHNQNPPIKVFFPYNPWDQGTNYCGLPDYQMMAKFLNETGADGFEGDTMSAIPEEFYSYSVSEYNHPIAMEPGGGGNLQSMNYNGDVIGWGNWMSNMKGYPYKPVIGKWKWYDSHRMTLVDSRWEHNHTDSIQNAFFNAIGFNSWQNVWGCYNEMVPRDGEALRRVANILRYFGNKSYKLTQSTDWLPFIPIIQQKYWNDLFASYFVINKGNDKQQYYIY
eukprot:262543_1